jgi:hypothetical protein
VFVHGWDAAVAAAGSPEFTGLGTQWRLWGESPSPSSLDMPDLAFSNIEPTFPRPISPIDLAFSNADFGLLTSTSAESVSERRCRIASASACAASGESGGLDGFFSPDLSARSFSPKLGGLNIFSRPSPIFSSPLHGALPAGAPSLLSRGCMQKSALSFTGTSADFSCFCDFGEANGETGRVLVGDLASVGPAELRRTLGPSSRSRPPSLVAAVIEDTNSALELATSLGLSVFFAPAAPAWSPCSPNFSCTWLIRLVSACFCSFKFANSSSAAEGRGHAGFARI